MSPVVISTPPAWYKVKVPVLRIESFGDKTIERSWLTIAAASLFCNNNVPVFTILSPVILILALVVPSLSTETCPLLIVSPVILMFNRLPL